MADIELKNILEQASLVSVLALKKMTLIKVTTILCNNQPLIDMIIKCESNEVYTTRNSKDFKDVKDMANELISKIAAFGIYKEMILDFLWPVAYRIIRWKHVFFSKIDTKFLNYFYWTNRGTIDTKKTAKYIITNGAISITKRFELACTLCLVEDIHNLWGIMVSQGNIHTFLENRENLNQLAIFWLKKLTQIRYLPEDMDELFEFAIKIHSIDAVKYLLSITPRNLKSDKAMMCFEGLSEALRTRFFREEKSEICYFIISQMTLPNYESFYISNFRLILSLLPYSSEINYFLKAWTVGLSFASFKDLEIAFYTIFYKYRMEVFRDHDYRKLFVSAWQELPDSWKDTLRTESNIGTVCFCSLVQDEFQFISQQEASANMANVIALNLKLRTSEIIFDFKQDKWIFLHFLIEEEMVTILTLENKMDVVSRMFPGRNQVLSCKSFIRFVSENIKKKKQN